MQGSRQLVKVAFTVVASMSKNVQTKYSGEAVIGHYTYTISKEGMFYVLDILN